VATRPAATGMRCAALRCAAAPLWLVTCAWAGMSPQRRMIHVMVSSARRVMCGEMGVQLADTMPEVTAGMGIGAGFGMGRRTRMMIAHPRVAARHLVSGRVREHQEYQRRSESIMTGRAAAAVHRHCTTRMAEARMTRGPASRTHRPAVAASLCTAIPAAADSCHVEAFGRTTHRISVVIVIISKLLGTGSIRSIATPKKRVCPCPCPCPCPCLPQSSPAHPRGKCFGCAEPEREPDLEQVLTRVPRQTHAQCQPAPKPQVGSMEQAPRRRARR